jgi:hypothetical protein
MEDAERQRIERIRQLLFPNEYSSRQQDPRPQSYVPYPTASNSDFGRRLSQMFVPPARQPLSPGQTLQGLGFGMMNGFTRYGTPSSPVVLDDRTSQAGSTRRHIFSPLLTPPIATRQYPFGSVPGDRHIWDPRPGDYSVPAPDAKEIKELLSNIRPDDDIEMDKDAVIPGLASHVRLMKHQQASHFSIRLTLDGLGVDAKDGGRQNARWPPGRRDGSREDHSEVWSACSELKVVLP